MRAKTLLAITITLIIMAFFFFKERAVSPLEVAEAPIQTDLVAKEADIKSESKQVIADQAADTTSIKEKSDQTITPEQMEQIEVTFSDNLKQLGTCLGIQPSVDADKIAPSFDNLVSSLKPALGEIVVKMDDWTQNDFRYDDGSKKRIRTETEYLDTGSPVRRAQLYKINDQGMPELQPLATDAATDPSDEFLSTLRGEGQETLEEKGGRVYYQEGEELVLVERSGKVQSFSLSKGEKTFSCTETDATSANCQCL